MSILKGIKDEIINCLILDKCKEESLQKDIVTLLQHLVFKSPVTIEYRTELSKTITTVIQNMSIINLLSFIKFIKKCSTSKIVNQRIISISIAVSFLYNKCIYFDENVFIL